MWLTIILIVLAQFKTDVPFEKIPEMPPSWWMQAAVILIVGTIAIAAFGGMFYFGRSFNRHMDRAAVQSKDDRDMHRDTVKTIVEVHGKVVEKIGILDDTMRDHGHKIDRLVEAVRR